MAPMVVKGFILCHKSIFKYLLIFNIKLEFDINSEVALPPVS